MAFLNSATALAVYRDGRHDEAIEVARRILALDPNAVEAHLCLALIAIRRNDVDGMVAGLRGCVRSRPAEWIVERLRRDFEKLGFPAMSRDLALRFGGFLRSQLSPLGPILPPDQRRSAHPFANVVGTSYVRSFGGSTAFFPLFIGMGPTMLLLTEEAAAVTQRKFAENLRRMDGSRDTLLVVGGDAYYHHRDLLKTRTHQEDGPQEEDFELMRTVARRHGPILADARKQVSGRLFLLGSTPTYSAFVDELALRLNDLLRPLCAEHGIELLDCWEDLADPVTQRLRADYSANAYPGDIHYSLAATPIFIDALKAHGVFGPETTSQADFEWTGVYECEIDKSERTRIWCEPSVSPNNAFKSDKIASSHLNQRMADLLVCLAAQGAGRTIAMVNVRDGGPAVFVPPQVQAGCLALTDTEQNHRAAQMVLDFYGRSDVQLQLQTPQAIEALAGAQFWCLLLCLHPDTHEADLRRCNEVLRRIGPCQLVVIATADPDCVGDLELGARQVRNAIQISNRHIPEKWRRYTLFIAN